MGGNRFADAASEDLCRTLGIESPFSGKAGAGSAGVGAGSASALEEAVAPQYARWVLNVGCSLL